MNSTKIENLAAPVSANDAARLADLNSAVEGLAWKDSVRVKTTGNINLASPGTTIDGITMASGDRFLVASQTLPEANGIYVFNGSATPATRAPDTSTAAELESATMVVEEGTANAGTTWRQTSVNFVLDTGAVAFTTFGTSVGAASETSSGIAELATQAETDTGTDDARIVTPLKLATWSGRTRKFTASVGDGAATQYDISHNLNTRDVIVQVYRNASPYDHIIVDTSANTVNITRLNFAVAPSVGQFRIVVTG